MADLLPVGIDSTTGQLRQLVFGTDTMRSGTNDFSSSVYTGGDISLTTSNDADYVDVDSTNAQITFTVTSPGKFIVSFNFSVNVVGTSGSSLLTGEAFRLTDGTTDSASSTISMDIGAIAAFTPSLTQQVVINTVYNFSTTGSKTIKLQRFNFTSTNITSRSVLANDDSALKMFVVRTAD